MHAPGWPPSPRAHNGPFIKLGAHLPLDGKWSAEGWAAWAEGLPRRQAVEAAVMLNSAADWARPLATTYDVGQADMADLYLTDEQRNEWAQLRWRADRDVVIFTERAAMHVGLLAVAYGDDEASDENPESLSRELAECAMRLDCDWDRDVVPGDSVAQYREGVFFRRRAARWSFLTSYELFHDTIPGGPSRWPTVAQAIEGVPGVRGFSVLDALGFSFAMSNPLFFRPDPRPGMVELDPETVERVAELLGSVAPFWAWLEKASWQLDENSRAIAISDLRRNTAWAFRLFHDMPFWRVEGSRFVAVRPTYVEQRGSPEALFWLVRETLETWEEGEAFITEFGKPFEMHAHMVVERSGRTTVYRETDAPLRPHADATRICDTTAIGEDGIAVLIEAKVSNVPLPHRIGGGSTDVESVLPWATLGDALAQLNDTALRLDHDGAKIAVAVISLESTWTTQHEYEIRGRWIAERNATHGENALFVEVPVVLIDLAGLTLVAAVARAVGRPLGTLLVEYIEWRDQHDGHCQDVFQWPLPGGYPDPSANEKAFLDWLSADGFFGLTRIVRPFG